MLTTCGHAMCAVARWCTRHVGAVAINSASSATLARGREKSANEGEDEAHEQADDPTRDGRWEADLHDGEPCRRGIGLDADCEPDGRPDRPG
jgi:hypothetical protein